MLPLLGACAGDSHGHEDLWTVEECDNPRAEQYWDGTEVIGCVRNVKEEIIANDGLRVYAHPETGEISEVQTNEKDGRLGPEEYSYSQAVEEATRIGLDKGYDAVREIYPKETDPKKRWVVDMSEKPVRWGTEQVNDLYMDSIQKRYVTLFDINHDGYLDKEDDVNGDNRISREDWELSQKKKP